MLDILRLFQELCRGITGFNLLSQMYRNCTVLVISLQNFKSSPKSSPKVVIQALKGRTSWTVWIAAFIFQVLLLLPDDIALLQICILAFACVYFGTTQANNAQLPHTLPVFTSQLTPQRSLADVYQSNLSKAIKWIPPHMISLWTKNSIFVVSALRWKSFTLVLCSVESQWHRKQINCT